jgi:hypothetical protein
VPYIHEDRINKEEFLGALTKLYQMTPAERRAMGAQGREWTQKKFNFEDFMTAWDNLFMQIYENKGSWEDREGYTPYEVRIL